MMNRLNNKPGPKPAEATFPPPDLPEDLRDRRRGAAPLRFCLADARCPPPCHPTGSIPVSLLRQRGARSRSRVQQRRHSFAGGRQVEPAEDFAPLETALEEELPPAVAVVRLPPHHLSTAGSPHPH